MSKRKTNPRKTRVSQSDVPSLGIDRASAVAHALATQYASKPTKPLNVAAALNLKPTSGGFRMLCGASIAYGLTIGGANANEIEITELGKRMTKPLRVGQDILAKREAFLKPRVIGEFLREYNGSSVPKKVIALNVLEEMSVPRERADNVFQLIMDGAKSLGLLQEIKNQYYVNLNDDPNLEANDITAELPLGSEDQERRDIEKEEYAVSPEESKVDSNIASLIDRKKHVFIAHGKDTSFLNPIKELLLFGELTPVVSAEKQSVSRPVPDKVLVDMRNCGAAIIHVDAERTLKDVEGNEHVTMNENVLIEIGAAMALYGTRFVLVVKKGVTLPSNLQGLYEVRYDGDQLDYAATINILKAIRDIKNHMLPEEKVT